MSRWELCASWDVGDEIMANKVEPSKLDPFENKALSLWERWVMDIQGRDCSWLLGWEIGDTDRDRDR